MSPPSAWAMEQAASLIARTQGGWWTHADIAAELDAAREEGRREMADACVTAALPGRLSYAHDAAENIRRGVAELRDAAFLAGARAGLEAAARECGAVCADYDHPTVSATMARACRDAIRAIDPDTLR